MATNGYPGDLDRLAESAITGWTVGAKPETRFASSTPVTRHPPHGLDKQNVRFLGTRNYQSNARLCAVSHHIQAHDGEEKWRE